MHLKSNTKWFILYSVVGRQNGSCCQFSIKNIILGFSLDKFLGGATLMSTYVAKLKFLSPMHFEGAYVFMKKYVNYK